MHVRDSDNEWDSTSPRISKHRTTVVLLCASTTPALNPPKNKSTKTIRSLHSPPTPLTNTTSQHHSGVHEVHTHAFPIITHHTQISNVEVPQRQRPLPVPVPLPHSRTKLPCRHSIPPVFPWQKKRHTHSHRGRRRRRRRRRTMQRNTHASFSVTPPPPCNRSIPHMDQCDTDHPTMSQSCQGDNFPHLVTVLSGRQRSECCSAAVARHSSPWTELHRSLSSGVVLRAVYVCV